jgi:hypothetical protein
MTRRQRTIIDWVFCWVVILSLPLAIAFILYVLLLN